MTVAPLPPEERGALRPLLDENKPGDALALYYALHHPAARSRFWIHRPAAGASVDGFIVRAQTGQDLFRPFLTLRAPSSSAAGELLRAAIAPAQPALFSLPEPLALWVLPHLAVESQRVLRLLRLNRARFEPVSNIFVRQSQSPDGSSRFEIRSGDALVAAAGVNWHFPPWAEIFVQVDPASRERGYGRSVCAGLCQYLLDGNTSVLFSVEEGNHASLRLAQSVGFEDTGERELFITGSLAHSQN